MKKQWQQWIRMRSKIHGAQAKPILPTAEDSSSIFHQKMVSPKPAESQAKGAGPKGGMNAESQTYYESVARSIASRFIELKQQFIESRDDNLKVSAERAIERLSYSLPDAMRTTVITCPQAYQILTCLAFFGIQSYPSKIVEDIVEVITAKSYSLPANRICQLLWAISSLAPRNLKSILHDFAPRLVQVMDELTQSEIASLIGIYGQHRVLERDLITAMVKLFMEMGNASLTDLRCLFSGLYQLEYVQDLTLVAQIAERTGNSLRMTISNSGSVSATDALSILQAAEFYRIRCIPLYNALCEIIEQNLEAMPISQAIDAVCLIQRTLYSNGSEVVNIVRHIKRNSSSNPSALRPLKSVQLWISLLLADGHLNDEYPLLASVAQKNINLLSFTELSQCFLSLAEVISKNIEEETLPFFRLNCTMHEVIDTFFVRLKNISTSSKSLPARLNILVALGKLNYLDSDSTLTAHLFAEKLESRLSYIKDVFAELSDSVLLNAQLNVKSADTKLPQQSQKNHRGVTPLCFHGGRGKCNFVLSYYFGKDGVFGRTATDGSQSKTFSGICNAFQSIVNK